jgi:DNA-binding MarR family transcriptional regulator
MPSDKQKLFQEYVLTMMHASRLGADIMDISLQDKVATVLQMQALLYLKENPNIRVGELGRALHMSSPAVAQFTKRLIRSGYLIKEVNKNDRRSARLFLSAKGEKESQCLPGVIARKADKILQFVSVEDMQTVIHIANKVIDTIENQK